MSDYQWINSRDELEEKLLDMMSAATEDAKSAEKTWTEKVEYTEEVSAFLTINVIAEGSSTTMSLNDFVDNLHNEINFYEGGKYEKKVKETLKGKTMYCKIIIEAAPPAYKEPGY
ncbi:hypothetical protein [Pseudomonas sp. RA_105y_Pfl2_P56]|uniref:hypothetical protein n=1 Tax=Pseudomonas sp. RA_105y_Pfl2_P56 TaxID=3088701 RepID=UPI0030D9C23E